MSIYIVHCRKEPLKRRGWNGSSAVMGEVGSETGRDGNELYGMRVIPVSMQDTSIL